jgi:hypothetical protein
MASVIFAVPRHVHSHVSGRTASELYGFAKTTVVIMSVALPTVIGFVIVLQAMLNTPVLITPISVPDSYQKSGYSSEAATQRLLDEIATRLRKPELKRMSALSLPSVVNRTSRRSAMTRSGRSSRGSRRSWSSSNLPNGSYIVSGP